jgi:ABC-type sugar transport system ATPase subunit
MIILDEPTAALGVVQTEQVLALIHHLRDRALAVVVIGAVPAAARAASDAALS